MECPQCQRDVIGWHCPCGWRKEGAAAANNWVITTCETPGCDVRIRYKLGTHQDLTCKWCRSGTARYRRYVEGYDHG